MSDAKAPTPTVEDVDLAFAVMQSVYGEIGESVKRDNPLGVRAAEDAILLDAYRQYGTTKRNIEVGGETVGSISLVFDKGYEITDKVEYGKWAQDNGMVEQGSERVDLSALSDEDGAALVEYVKARFPHAVVRDSRLRVPDDGDLAHAGGDVVYVPTGEVVPGLRWYNEPRGTRISGVKWHGNRTYGPVKVALLSLGVGPGDVVGYLTGGDD